MHLYHLSGEDLFCRLPVLVSGRLLVCLALGRDRLDHLDGRRPCLAGSLCHVDLGWKSVWFLVVYAYQIHLVLLVDPRLCLFEDCEIDSIAFSVRRGRNHLSLSLFHLCLHYDEGTCPCLCRPFPNFGRVACGLHEKTYLVRVKVNSIPLQGVAVTQ